MKGAEVCQPFVVGGCSAMLASTCVHPIDLAKVRMQLYSTVHVENAKSPNFAKVLKDMVRSEGFLSIYSGISASLLRQAIYGTTRLGLHRTFSDKLKQRTHSDTLSFPSKVLCAMMSGSIATCFGTPCDVALVRMQSDSMTAVDKRRGYRNVLDALRRIVKEEGVRTLYSGLLPSILRAMAINTGMMAFFDQAIESIQRLRGENTRHATTKSTLLMSSAIAGFTNAAVSIPFDQIKSRLQHGGNYKGVVDVIQNIVKKEGVSAFYTGFGAYYMRSAPHAMIVLLAMEPIGRCYRKIFQLDT